MRKTIIPWLSWKDVMESSWVGKPFYSIFWFVDKIGWLVEQTPLCVFFCSFWLDRYLPKAKTVIQSYRSLELNQIECEKKLRGIDRRIYLYWLTAAAPWLFSLFVLSSAMALRAYIHARPLLYFVSIAIILILHEAACPSSLRHHKASLRRGDNEMAGMNELASPSTRRYFRRKVLGITVEQELEESMRKIDAWFDKHS